MIDFLVESTPENNANNANNFPQAVFSPSNERTPPEQAAPDLERTSESVNRSVATDGRSDTSQTESECAPHARRSRPALSIASDSGQRPYMEDSSAGIFITRANSDGTHEQDQVLIVADGVGGQQGGAAASNISVPTLARELQSFLLTTRGTPDAGDLLTALESRVRQTNADLVRLAQREPALADMATTIVVGVIVGSVLAVGWAGDSRAYLWRRGAVVRLTTDHSAHEGSHQITQCLGMSCDFQPSFRALNLEPGDAVLLVTDGVTDVLSDDDLADLVAEFRHAGANAVAHAIADAALDSGTTDNVTVLCSFPEGVSPSSPARI